MEAAKEKMEQRKKWQLLGFPKDYDEDGIINLSRTIPLSNTNSLDQRSPVRREENTHFRDPQINQTNQYLNPEPYI